MSTNRGNGQNGFSDNVSQYGSSYTSQYAAQHGVSVSQKKKNLEGTEQKIKLQEKKKIYKTLYYSIMMATTISVLVLGVVVFFLSRVEINTIVMKGNISFPKNILLEQIRLDFPSTYFNVDVDEVKEKLELHPLIYKAEVKKSISGELIIILERSSPIVSILSEKNGKQTPSYFDNKGRCVQVGIGLGIVDVPILSGLTLIAPKVGVYLPEWTTNILSKLNTIKKDNSDLYKQISEVNIKDQGQGYKILEISFIGLASKFLTEIDINEHTMQEIWKLASKFEQLPEFNDFDYFDVRQGVIIGKKGG